MKNLSLADIKASYTEVKKEEAKKDPWAYYIARPISFYLTYWLIKMGVVTPVHVVFAGLGIGMVGCAFLMLGNYWAVILGAVLVNVHGLLDYVDGNVARTLNKVDKYGARMDGVSYLIITTLIFTSVGIGTGYVALGLTAALLRLLRYAITYQHNLPGEPLKTNMLYRVGMVAITVREPLLLVCALTGTLYWFLAFYVVVHMGELGVILVKVFKR